jgi:hypothetical protein
MFLFAWPCHWSSHTNNVCCTSFRLLIPLHATFSTATLAGTVPVFRSVSLDASLTVRSSQVSPPSDCAVWETASDVRWPKNKKNIRGRDRQTDRPVVKAIQNECKCILCFTAGAATKIQLSVQLEGYFLRELPARPRRPRGGSTL